MKKEKIVRWNSLLIREEEKKTEDEGKEKKIYGTEYHNHKGQEIPARLTYRGEERKNGGNSRGLVVTPLTVGDMVVVMKVKC